MGNSNKPFIQKMMAKGAELQLVWFLDQRGKPSIHENLLEMPNNGKEAFESAEFPITSTNFYRRDDVCFTAYFYLDRPSNKLPKLPCVEYRLKNLHKRV